MYDLLLEPEVHASRHTLPGHIRQRLRHLINDLATNPRPHISRLLNTADIEIPPNVAILRLRIEGWRIVYAVNDIEAWVWVLGIYRRPPYDYGDLRDLVARVSNR